MEDGHTLESDDLSAGDIPSVARMFRRLAYHVRDVSIDPYFDYAELETGSVEEALAAALADSRQRVIICRSGDEPVAFLWCAVRSCFLPVSSVKETGYINAAWTEPEYRGQGIMRRLMEEAERFFRDRSLGYVELHVLAKNADAKSAWERLGFSTFREQMRREL